MDNDILNKGDADKKYEQKLEMNKRYKEEHRDDVLKYYREYYEKNKDKMKQQIKANQERYCDICGCHVKKYFDHKKTKKHIMNEKIKN